MDRVTIPNNDGTQYEVVDGVSVEGEKYYIVKLASTKYVEGLLASYILVPRSAAHRPTEANEE